MKAPTVEGGTVARGAVALGGVGVFVLFLGALVEAAPPARVHVAVIAESRVDPGAQPWVVRLSAVDVSAQRPARVAGTVEVGSTQAPLVDEIARVHLPADAREVALSLVVDDHTALSLRCPLGQAPPAPGPSRPLLVDAARVVPTVLGVRTRAVGLQLDAGRAVVHIASPSSERLAVELLVRGVLRDVRVVDGQPEQDVTFTLPPDTADTDLVVAHVAEPWPLARGSFAVATRAGGAVATDGKRPATLRPEPLACTEVAARFPHALRTAFEAGAVVFVLALVVGLLLRVRAEGRRAALLAAGAGLVLAVFFAALDLALRLGAPGAP